MNLKNHKRSEATEQIQVMNWCKVNCDMMPELGLIFHIPNGGSRNQREAANLKAQGVKAGVPDLFLPVARGKFHGLFIEMKYGRNKPTDKQIEWIKALEEQGYKCAVCYGAEMAVYTIKEYLQG